MSVALTTRRLHLRPLGATDADVLHALAVDPAVRRYLFDDRRIPPDEARRLAEASAADHAERGYGLWLCAAAPHGEPLGFAGFLRGTGDVPELVYALLPAHHGCGYATEAARALLGDLFARTPVPRVTASVDLPNAASIRVLERLGFAPLREEDGAAHRLRVYALERGPTG